MDQINVFEILYEPYKITKPIRLIECFAGIGSQAKALERLNVDFKHYKVVEFDKYAIKSYNAIHGTNFETSDITKIHAKDLEIVETDKYEYIMTYSFPCQDLSLAGKQRGMKKGSGTRSGLLWEVERLLDECVETNGNLPQILLMENVPEVIGSKNIEHFQEWERKLESLGYRNYCQVLNAKDYGIPQNRKRCFMISILGDYYYEFPKPFKLKLKLKDVLEDEVDEKYYLSKKMIAYISSQGTKNFKNCDCRINLDIARPLTTDQGKRAGATNYICDDLLENYDLRELDNEEFLMIRKATKKGYTEAKDGDGVYINRPHQKRGVVQNGMIQTLKTSCSDVGVVVGTYQHAKSDNFMNGKSRFNEGKDIADTIQTSPKEGIVIGSTQKNAYVGTTDEPSPTLTSAMGSGGGHIPMLEHNLRIRKLTPLECFRLMGFDDEDFYKAEKVNSNTQLYKQAGNSIVVNVLEEIFKKLF